VAVLKRLKNNKAPGGDNVVKQFSKYDGCEVRDKLLKLMNMMFEKREVLSDFRKTLIKPLHEEGDSYRGISLVSIGSKFLSMMILLRCCR